MLLKHIVIIIFLILFIFIMYCTLLLANDANEVDPMIHEQPGNKFMMMVSPNQKKQLLPHDCSHEYVVGFSDAYCNDICSQVNPQYNYVLSDGLCVTKKVASNADHCQLEKGFITMLRYNSFFDGVEYLCSTIDPGIADLSYSTNQLCINGTIVGGIDYRKEIPSLLSCECAADMVLFTTTNSYNVRANGMCVPKVFEKMIKDTKLDKNHVIY